MTVKSVTMDPQTHEERVRTVNIDPSMITGFGKSMKNEGEGRVFIVGFGNIATRDSLSELARKYLEEIEE